MACNAELDAVRAVTGGHLHQVHLRSRRRRQLRLHRHLLRRDHSARRRQRKHVPLAVGIRDSCHRFVAGVWDLPQPSPEHKVLELPEELRRRQLRHLVLRARVARRCIGIRGGITLQQIIDVAWRLAGLRSLSLRGVNLLDL